MRNKLIAANWKMNAGPEEAGTLLTRIEEKLKGTKMKSDVLVCPPFVSLGRAREILQDSEVQLGAQNVHHEDHGAYTGEISASMLKESGCTWVIVGHSERREYFSEDDLLIRKKVRKALDEKLNVILCVGEKLDQREKEEHQQVVMDQIRAVTDHLTEKGVELLTIAYEPVWAIGTGETATPEQAQEMHRFIRDLVAEQWTTHHAENLRILYGGSMNPKNAEELLVQPDVDGGLIGGASLKPDSFYEIIQTAESILVQ